MTTLLFTNSASSALASSITDSELSLTVNAADGILFPAPQSGQAFYIAVTNVAGDMEIMLCTSRTGDVLTIVRAQDTTIARAWDTGDRVELRLTAAVMNALLQSTGGTLTGNLNLNGNAVYGGVIQGALNDDTWEFRVPVLGGRPTMGPAGRQVLLAPVGVSDARVDQWVLPAGLVCMWTGAQGTIPSGWYLCDGTNGTADMRDKFIMAPADYVNIGTTGDGSAGVTDAGGTHDHGAAVGETALTVAQMPTHRHNSGVGDNEDRMFVYGGTSEDTPGGAINSITSASASSDLQGLTSEVGSGAAHGHTIPPALDHTHGITNYTPRFYATAFIMKAPAS